MIKMKKMQLHMMKRCFLHDMQIFGHSQVARGRQEKGGSRCRSLNLYNGTFCAMGCFLGLCTADKLVPE
jgi:hypothetical protein